MHAEVSSRVVVFGGTGFLGRRIVNYLLAAGLSVRVASRRPNRAHELFGNRNPNLEVRQEAGYLMRRPPHPRSCFF
jgi:uncharacterized protein YbjT (DUF2867 family)